ncbi:HPr kinase/phosphorylase [Yoonia sp. 208BN28-4]|uniref:HPr kinase/phosphorylase n=1 Tax=Yoonia sp. 208BN28-4 TaxID=3126505 RepID=UPI0030AED17A
MATAPDHLIVHASSVAVDGAALLITGASGSGKSGLALEMMSRGATLVADDRVMLKAVGKQLIAECPATISGLIEARGIGILSADTCGPTPVIAQIDLDTSEPVRLPPARDITVLGVTIPLFHKPQSPHLAAAMIQFLRAGLSDR